MVAEVLKNGSTDKVDTRRDKFMVDFVSLSCFKKWRKMKQELSKKIDDLIDKVSMSLKTYVNMNRTRPRLRVHAVSLCPNCWSIALPVCVKGVEKKIDRMRQEELVGGPFATSDAELILA